MDGRKLWQEGGRNGDGDVAGGCHAAFVVHIPAEQNQLWASQRLKHTKHSLTCARLVVTWRSGLWWLDTLPWRRCARRSWTTPRNMSLHTQTLTVSHVFMLRVSAAFTQSYRITENKLTQTYNLSGWFIQLEERNKSSSCWNGFVFRTFGSV